MTTFIYFAQSTYNCDAYGSGAYSNQCTATADQGSLVDTGYDVLLPIILGVSLIGASVILVVKRALRKRNQAPTV